MWVLTPQEGQKQFVEWGWESHILKNKTDWVVQAQQEYCQNVLRSLLLVLPAGGYDTKRFEKTPHGLKCNF